MIIVIIVCYYVLFTRCFDYFALEGIARARGATVNGRRLDEQYRSMWSNNVSPPVRQPRPLLTCALRVPSLLRGLIKVVK